MSKKFDSVLASPMGVFVRSPLGVREAGGRRSVYVDSWDFRILDNTQHYDEKLLRVSPDDLSLLVGEARPPWWPAPHSTLGQRWLGHSISGDDSVVWYSAFNLVDFFDLTETPDPNDYKWTIDIYKLTPAFEVLGQWRWQQPALGGGFVRNIVPFGNSEVLWGLAFVQQFTQPWRTIDKMFLVELDSANMTIKRSSSDLWGNLGSQGRLQRPFVHDGGGTASIIYTVTQLYPDFPDRSTGRSLIRTYSGESLTPIDVFDAPRSRNTGTSKRVVRGIGGNSESIWIASESFAFGTIPGTAAQAQFRISELPSDFSNENQTIIQDEIRAPWRYPVRIG